jgi:hypothetical protein
MIFNYHEISILGIRFAFNLTALHTLNESSRLLELKIRN